MIGALFFAEALAGGRRIAAVIVWEGIVTLVCLLRFVTMAWAQGE